MCLNGVTLVKKARLLFVRIVATTTLFTSLAGASGVVQAAKKRFTSMTGSWDRTMNEAAKFLKGMEWIGSRLQGSEPQPDRLLQKAFKCTEARDRARDPEVKAIWESHAEVLRARLRKELN